MRFVRCSAIKSNQREADMGKKKDTARKAKKAEKKAAKLTTPTVDTPAVPETPPTPVTTDDSPAGDDDGSVEGDNPFST